jgi:hypothetical protein
MKIMPGGGSRLRSAPASPAGASAAMAFLPPSPEIQRRSLRFSGNRCTEPGRELSGFYLKWTQGIPDLAGARRHRIPLK